jgi:hypothetical protein
MKIVKAAMVTMTDAVIAGMRYLPQHAIQHTAKSQRIRESDGTLTVLVGGEKLGEKQPRR